MIPVQRPPRRRLISKGEVIYVLSFVAVVLTLIYLGSAFPWLVGKINQRAQSAATTGPHAFLDTTPTGRPVTYDSCRPIHYVVNPAGMPSGGMELIRDAIRTISAATGLTFTEDGFTQEPPGRADRLRGHGPQWPPVLIAWASQSEYPPLRGPVAGIGGSMFYAPNGLESKRYVTGEVVLDRKDFANILAHGDYGEARAIVTHELGHLVGLDHVRDSGELMAEENTGQTELGPGDRQGLAAAGAGPCWPDA